jgi:hypothetical protein
MKIYICPLLDFGFIGPTTSSPHWKNGCSTVIGYNDITNLFIFPENCWLYIHFLIVAYESLKIDGQEKPSLIILWVVVVGEKCPQHIPSWNSLISYWALFSSTHLNNIPS